MRILVALLLLFTTAASAGDGGLLPGLLSAPLTLPVTISGSELSLDSYVVRPDRPGRSPLVLMVHGTPDAEGVQFLREIASRSPVSFNKAAIAFAQRGYAAAAIMRRGFGRSGGVYSERLQRACDYLPAVRISAEDVIAAVTTLRTEPWVDADHVVLLGLSTGGLAVTAAAARNPAGVVGVLNFDGGRHGRSSPGQACNPDNLVDTLADLGRTARAPALWLYTENDQSYGPALAHRMYDAYTAAGAPAQLYVLPPFGSDGHNFVTDFPAESWLPAVEPFLAGLDLPTALIISLPPPPELPPPPSALPVCKTVFTNYLSFRWDAKAFAIAPTGGCGAAGGRTADEAREAAIADCEVHTHGADCKLYAIGQHLAKID